MAMAAATYPCAGKKVYSKAMNTVMPSTTDLSRHQPNWPAPANVRALCTTRWGVGGVDGQWHAGASQGPYAQFNLGDHVGDTVQAVANNRQLLHTACGVKNIFLQQVHGTQVLELRQGAADGAPADASTTTAHGLACTIMVADCLPILLCNTSGTRVAAVHAGWRGLAAGVIENTLEHFIPKTHENTAQGAMKNVVCENPVMAWLGPCIGKEAFEVGPEVQLAFLQRYGFAANFFFAAAGRKGKYLCDLAGLAAAVLRHAGVDLISGNDGSQDWCTYSRPQTWFSHRRAAQAGGQTGRLAACVWLQN